MKISEVDKAFESFVNEKKLDVFLPNDLKAAVEAWLDFYEQKRVDAVHSVNGAWPDALLFEWGYQEALEGYYEACFRRPSRIE